MKRLSIKPMKNHQGAALVITLALLVLMLGIVLAFFSQTILQKSISNKSSASFRLDILSEVALLTIKSDLLAEMQSGSELDGSGYASPILQPLLVQTSNQWIGTNVFISTAPSLVPQKMVRPQAPPRLWKQSLAGQASFQITNGFTNHSGIPPPVVRASDVNASTQPLQGRAVAPKRWALPQFSDNGQDVPVPDWIYIDRLGGNPVVFSNNLTTAKAENSEFVIGRFAFNAYEVGGLLDVNVVGNNLSAAENSIRGRAHAISLANAPAPLASSRFSDFVTWRSGAIASNAEFLNDPKRTFLKAPPNTQAVVTRQDLLRYVNLSGNISESALPFLTTFSRDINAPSFAPEKNRPLWPNPLDARRINPILTQVRFPDDTLLARGVDVDVTVPAGTPVFARRFPLSKLNILSEANPNAESLVYFFGVEKRADNLLRYTEASSDGRIKRLDEVADEGREPNFFELLQAVITAGSLGRNAGNTLTTDHARDGLRNLQILQIGANIMDQWDSDDIPTTLEYPSGISGDFLNVHGIENLPYFNNFEIVAFRPSFDRDRLQAWMVFDVWNPHQNAAEPPQGISQFRIKARDGKFGVTYWYSFRGEPFGSSSTTTRIGNETPLEYQSFSELNASRDLVFPAAGNYSQPTVIGATEPDSETYTGGLLMNELKEVGASVSDDPTVWSAATRSQVSQILAHFGRSPLPPSGSGKFGAKAQNVFRIRSELGDEPSVDLQYLPSGLSADVDSNWRTYQSIERLIPSSSAPLPLTGTSVGISTVTHYDGAGADEIDRISFHGASGWQEFLNDGNGHSFYRWRDVHPGSSTFRSLSGGVKFDPRTTRFGHSDTFFQTLGGTVRKSPDNPLWSGGINVVAKNPMWLALRGDRLAGKNAAVFDPLPFEYHSIHPSVRAPFGFMRNIPEGSVNSFGNLGRYADQDGVIRPADAYLDTLPTAVPILGAGRGGLGDRPVILNRSFRSVAELGNTFRDLPWKSLDFFTKNSGDLGLLDAFSIDETDDALPIVAGKVNLNTAPVEVLSTLLRGASLDASGGNTISGALADQVAEAIVTERSRGPFLSRGDLVSRVLSPTSASSLGGVPGVIRKSERESVIRALGELGTTRTWTFLIDMIVQTGRLTAQSKSLQDFVVDSEGRYWVHLAIDRFTGEVVDLQWEVVHE